MALLLIDMMNDLDFPAGDELLTSAIPVAHQIALLKLQARDQNVPVIYVNDNFGRWRSDFNARKWNIACGMEPRQTNRGITTTRPGRLLCPEAKALRLFLHNP